MKWLKDAKRSCRNGFSPCPCHGAQVIPKALQPNLSEAAGHQHTFQSTLAANGSGCCCDTHGTTDFQCFRSTEKLGHKLLMLARPSKYCLELQHLLGAVVSQGHCEDLFLLHQVFTFQSWVCWTCLFLLSVDGSEIPYGEWGVTFGSSGEVEKCMSICLFAVGHWLRQLEIRACKISLLDLASLDLVLFPDEKRNGKSQEICDLYSHFPALQITAGEDLKVPFLSWQNVSRWDMMQFFPRLPKSESRVMNSRECWRSAGATGVKDDAVKIMRTRLMNSCSLTECIVSIVSCSLKKEGSYRGGGGKKNIMGLCLLKIAS